MTNSESARPAPRGSLGLTAGALFLLVVWLAFVTGMAEGAYRVVQKLVFGDITLRPLYVIWTLPLTNLVWLLVPALILLAAHRLVPSRITYPAAAAVMTTFAVFPLALLATSMHKAIVGLLVVGIGVQTFRMVAARPGGVHGLVRRTTIPLLLLAGFAGGIIGGIRVYREHRAMSALPAARPGMPNVLLIIWDTVRGSNLSLYGYHRPTTPFLEDFARSGARFDMAVATAPWTLPSHASMFTGQRPTALSARLNTPLDGTYPVIAEAFSRAGYATGGFVANMSYCSREHGLARGFAHYEDYRLAPGEMINASRLGQVMLRSQAVRRITGFYDLAGRKTAAQVNHGLLRWVDQHRDRPFFAFLNYFDAHQPYIAPQPFRSRFTFDSVAPYHPRTVDANYNELTAEEIHWSLGEYDAGIAYQDSAVANLMGELDRRGLLDNTVVIIVSDHGEHFGDHKRISHGNSLYRQLLHVPLVIRFPARVPAGTVVSAPVSLADLPQTMLHLAGLGDEQAFPGTSLQRFWETAESPTDQVVLSEMPTQPGVTPAYSLFANGYHYIRWFSRDPELYRLDSDPAEARNLARDPESAPVLRRFDALARETALKP